MNAELQRHTHTEINSRSTVAVDVKGKAIKCIEYNRRCLCDLGMGNDFSNKKTPASTSKEKSAQLSCINIKKFRSNPPLQNEKSQSQKIYVTSVTAKGHLCKI